MTRQPDLSGEQLSNQRFHMLEDIAKELADEVFFPTHFELSMQIRGACRESTQSFEQIISLISTEPLLCAKLVQQANSAPHNAAGIEVCDIPRAIERLGPEAVRATIMSVTASQMHNAHELAMFGDLTQKLWQHSKLTASAAYVVAKRLSRCNPDEAYLAGLVHDLGAFYMLYRAVQYSELRERPDSIPYLITQWHESIGQSVLASLKMPESITEAVRDHDVLRPTPPTPRTLKDVVYLANMLAGGNFEWMHQDVSAETIARFTPDPAYLALKSEIQTHMSDMATTQV